jgi:uncharacterized membrane protein
MHLLFWLSLVPFVTGWMGENNFAKLPVILYGFVLMMAGLAYNVLARILARLHGKDSTLAIVVSKDSKGIFSVLLYAIGIALCFINPWLGFAIYVFVAVIWFVPDTRIEERLAADKSPEGDSF